jgi:hypothetical protein
MLPPMVERELRVALLRRNARHQWMVAAWSAGGIFLGFVLLLGLASSRAMGRRLFVWLFAMACAGVVSRGFGLTADLFSEERRNGTLGLLVLAGLRPLEIFTNKQADAVGPHVDLGDGAGGASGAIIGACRRTRSHPRRCFLRRHVHLLRPAARPP